VPIEKNCGWSSGKPQDSVVRWPSDAYLCRLAVSQNDGEVISAEQQRQLKGISLPLIAALRLRIRPVPSLGRSLSRVVSRTKCNVPSQLASAQT
jgi:hypothetical protein